jgi:hypothetical protein
MSFAVSLIMLGYKLSSLDKLLELMHLRASLTEAIDAAIQQAVTGESGSAVAAAATLAIKRFGKVALPPMADRLSNRLGPNQFTVSDPSPSHRDSIAREQIALASCLASAGTYLSLSTELEEDARHSVGIGPDTVKAVDVGMSFGPSDAAERKGRTKSAEDDPEVSWGGVARQDQDPLPADGSDLERSGALLVAVRTAGLAGPFVSPRAKPREVNQVGEAVSPFLPNPAGPGAIGDAASSDDHRLELPWAGAIDTSHSSCISLTWDQSQEVAFIHLSSPSSDGATASDVDRGPEHDCDSGLWKRHHRSHKQEPLHVATDLAPAFPASPSRPIRPEYAELVHSMPSAAAIVFASSAIKRSAERDVQRRLRTLDEQIGLSWAARDRAEALAVAAEERADLVQARFVNEGESGMARLSVNWHKQSELASLSLSKSTLQGLEALSMPSSAAAPEDSPANAELRWI